jgi:hypothetical protein
MKKLIIAAMLVAFVFTVAYAADTVTYENKKGSVTFNHKVHGDKLGCEACHEGTPAKIAVDKKAAHGDTCKGCHKKQDGPTKCNDCHAK